MSTLLLEIGRGLHAIVDAGVLETIGLVNFRDGRQWAGRIGSLNWQPMYARGGIIYVRARMAVARIPSVLLLHRAITGVAGHLYVDHKNGNGLDNTRLNLRECCNADNIANSRPWRTNKTGFKGVYIGPRGKFISYISKCKKSVYLGTFDTAQEAGNAYDAAAIQLHGEFARTNSDQ